MKNKTQPETDLSFESDGSPWYRESLVYLEAFAHIRLNPVRNKKLK